jgi:hypothetical protein
VGTVWAAFAEFAPLPVKAIGGAAVGAIAAIGAVRVWVDKKQKDREEDK